MGGYGAAWLALCAAFAIHVADEALTNFLSVYNPTVRAIRAQFPFLPIPTFTFRAWLTGLVVAVIAVASLTPLAFRGAPGLRPVAYVLGLITAGNGMLHIVASIIARRAVPGVYSAALLVAAAAYLIVSVGG